MLEAVLLNAEAINAPYAAALVSEVVLEITTLERLKREKGIEGRSFNLRSSQNSCEKTGPVSNRCSSCTTSITYHVVGQGRSRSDDLTNDWDEGEDRNSES